MVLAFRLLGLRFGTLYWWRLIEYLLLLVLAVGASTILPLSWPVAFGIGAVAALLVAFISRMIDIADFRQLLTDAGQVVKKKPKKSRQANEPRRPCFLMKYGAVIQRFSGTALRQQSSLLRSLTLRRLLKRHSSSVPIRCG